MSEVKAGAGVALLQKGVLDGLQELNDKTRLRVSALLDEGDKVTASTPDGVRLGYVQLANGEKKPVVKDRAAVIAWCRTYRPDLLRFPEDTTRLEAAIEFFDDWKPDDTAAYESLLKVLTAAHSWLGELKRQGQEPTLANEKALLDSVKRDGGVIDKDTGEVQAVPGIVVEKAPGKFAVYVDHDNMPKIVDALLEKSGLKEIDSGG